MNNPSCDDLDIIAASKEFETIYPAMFSNEFHALIGDRNKPAHEFSITRTLKFSSFKKFLEAHSNEHDRS